METKHHNLTGHQISAYMSTLFKRFQRARRTSLSVARLWMYMLFGFLFVNILLLAWSVYLFVAIGEDAIFVAPVEQEQETLSLDRNELQSTLEAFTLRALQFEELQQTPPRTTDPAL